MKLLAAIYENSRTDYNNIIESVSDEEATDIITDVSKTNEISDKERSKLFQKRDETKHLTISSSNSNCLKSEIFNNKENIHISIESMNLSLKIKFPS